MLFCFCRFLYFYLLAHLNIIIYLHYLEILLLKSRIIYDEIAPIKVDEMIERISETYKKMYPKTPITSYTETKDINTEKNIKILNDKLEKLEEEYVNLFEDDEMTKNEE